MSSQIICETLPNGLEVVLKENHFTQTVAMQCWAGIGAAYETPAERGLSHFLEHMLFKGTERYQVGEIAGLVEACGGDINAYTSFEHTVFYLTLASQHAFTGIDILSQAMFKSTFVEEEFEREREVIIEEIRRGRDNPSMLLGHKLFEECYRDSEVGRPIIGFEEQIRNFTRGDLVGFHQRWYAPNNLTVVIVGDCDATEMLEQVYEKFGTEPQREVPTKIPVSPAPIRGVNVSVIKGEFQQPRLEMAFRGPSSQSLDSVALDLAAFALSAGESSRFNERLRDGEGSIIAASASAFTPVFPGLFELNAILAEDQFLPGLKGIAAELFQMRNAEGISGEELARARSCLRSDRFYRDETSEGQARSLGQGLTTEHNVLYDEVYATLIQHTPQTFVQDCLRRWIKADDVVIVALLPQNSSIDEQQIRNAYLAAVDASPPVRKTLSTVIRKGAVEAPRVDVANLRDGLKLVYRHNPDGQLFSLVMVTEGGLRAETDKEDFGSFNAMSGLLGVASESIDYASFVSRIEELGASVEGFSGKDSLGLQILCLPEHLDEVGSMAFGSLLRPVFPDRQWASLQREILQSIIAQEDSPASVCFREMQRLMYREHPYGHLTIGTKESVSAFTSDGLRREFAKYRDGGPWVIAAAGPQPFAEVRAFIEKRLAEFEPSARPRKFAPISLRDMTASSKHLPMDKEQQHIFCAFPGIGWGDANRATLDVLVNVLGGHGGRLFLQLRDQESLAYSVSPVVSYGCEPGIVGAYIATASEKAEQAQARLAEEVFRLREEDVAEAELMRAKNYIVGNHELGMQKSDAQTMTMALMELYGHGFDDFLSYPRRIETVEVADIKRVANQLLTRDAMTVVTVGGS